MSTHDKIREVGQLYGMKYGMYNPNSKNNGIKGKAYCLIFMTKKGKKLFYVETPMYNQIKMDSFVELSIHKDMIQSYKFIKIATKEDVKELGW